MTEKTLDFPNKSELKNSNSIEFRVFIPSTRAFSKNISKEAFAKRVNVATKFLSKLFGGATFDVETGTYQMKNKLIKERVAVIIVNASQADYNKYDVKLEDWLKLKKKTWEQDSMGFVYQGKMIFV